MRRVARASLATTVLACGSPISGGDESSSTAVPTSSSGSSTSAGPESSGSSTSAGPESGSNVTTDDGSSSSAESIDALGDCSAETNLAGREDVFFCDPYERADWFSAYEYVSTAYKTRDMIPAEAADVSNTQIVSEDCWSGSCLEVSMAAYQSGAVAVHWPLSNADGGEPDEVFLRYYLKLAPNFSPELCEEDEPHAPYDNGGKFPGLADVRVDNEATGEEQCGNGGEYADGINCWSMRAKFRNCLEGEGSPTQACDSPTATTRFGGYIYYPTSSQEFGNWDTVEWGSGLSDGPCDSDPTSVGNCGIGTGGQLENDRWYAIEMQVKMNTPGEPDGIVRGWVDEVLSYEKTNMIFRLPGHDDLHIRTMWLNVHAGGEFVGLCESSAIYIDQLVLAASRIGVVERREEE